MTLAVRKMAKASLKMEVLRREAVEDYIEQLIALLDQLDGEPDLEDNGDAEPSLGGPSYYLNGKLEHDLEGDTSDDELSLGFRNPQIGEYEMPEGWSPTDGENAIGIFFGGME